MSRCFSRKKLLSPKSNGITWLRRLSISPTGDGYVELPDDDRFHVDFEATLNIANVVYEDAGLYSCFQYGAEQTTYVLAIESQERKKRVGTAENRLWEERGRFETHLSNLMIFFVYYYAHKQQQYT